MAKKIKCFLLMLSALFICSLFTVSAKAAPYQMITHQKVKIDKYYFSYGDDTKVYYSTSKTAKGKAITGTNVSAVTNGKIVYYANGRLGGDGLNVYRYEISTKRKTKVKYVLHGEKLIGCYNGNLYFLRHNFYGNSVHDMEKCHVYSYNIATGKFKKVMDDVFASGDDKYFYGTSIAGYMKPQTLKLFDASTGKTKIIEKNCIFYRKIGSYIYVAKRISGNSVYKTRIAKYNLKTGKYTYASSKHFYCRYVAQLYSGKVSYRDKNRSYKEMSY